jgi:hypothetical protein
LEKGCSPGGWRGVCCGGLREMCDMGPETGDPNQRVFAVGTCQLPEALPCDFSHPGSGWAKAEGTEGGLRAHGVQDLILC